MKTKMKTNFILILLLPVFTLFNCKNETKLPEYKYANKPQTITCEGINSKLYQEAVYSFEDDILNHYRKNNQNTSLLAAYNQFLRNAIYGRLKYGDIVSAHTHKIFTALKNEADLWDANNPDSHLNYNSNIVSCIAANLQDEKLKTTFNSLLSTNFLKPKLISPALTSNYKNVIKDKHLAAYIAFDLYYAKLFDIDFSKINLDKPVGNVDFNLVPPKEPTPDPHAGHNN